MRFPSDGNAVRCVRYNSYLISWILTGPLLGMPRRDVDMDEVATRENSYTRDRDFP